MPAFGQRSRDRIATLDPRWRPILNRVIIHRDFTIICGHRGSEDQNEAFATGASTKKWPNSKHNSNPSLAVDLAPWNSGLPHIRWGNKEEFIFLAGMIILSSQSLSDQNRLSPRSYVRWGGDWDSDGDQSDQTFMDIGHFELVDG